MCVNTITLLPLMWLVLLVLASSMTLSGQLLCSGRVGRVGLRLEWAGLGWAEWDWVRDGKVVVKGFHVSRPKQQTASPADDRPVELRAYTSRECYGGRTGAKTARQGDDTSDGQCSLGPSITVHKLPEPEVCM